MDPRPLRHAAIAAVGLLVAGCATLAPQPSGSGSPPVDPPATAGPASAAPAPQASATAPNVPGEFRADRDRLTADLAALQAVAHEHGGIRASGTPGYDASVAYVAKELRDAGFEVETPEIGFTGFRDLGGRLEIDGRIFEDRGELRALIYSPGGRAAGPVTILDESGCRQSDFEDVSPGDLVLTTIGGCFRRDQALNASAAGASALLVGYPGRGAGEIFRPTLLDPAGIDIPVVSITDEAVRLLESSATPAASLSVATELPASTFSNVIGQLGDGPRVVMVGAHLDSVLDGPGINDNGSGVAAALEVARGFGRAGAPDGWALRIGLWGAEEFGLIGSRAYTATIGEEVEAYINLDMAGSVNGSTLVYDEADAAPGSERITAAFETWLADRGHPSERADLGGSSDHFGFIGAGVPTGGLFAGASASGSAAQPTAGGGGVDPDPCYHIGCDDLDNVDLELVGLFAEATRGAIDSLMSGD
jgi:Zn-dependent M28 family amino/carboxypeptidase